MGATLTPIPFSRVFTKITKGKLVKMSEESVQRTNDDATQCKMSAVAHGYWDDSYLSAFHKIRSGPDSRKAPEIHRGYYTRVKAIWNILVKSIDYFCARDQKFQVVNL